jgi:hypothetical protein
MQHSRQSNGGKAKAAKIRAGYLANPKLCLYCDDPILPGKVLAHARKKTYCSQRCSAHHLHALGRFKPKKRGLRKCEVCQSEYEAKASSPRKHCPTCWMVKRSATGKKTKGEARRMIRLHAAAQLSGRSRVCAECGYEAHVEACHVRPVRDFPLDATLNEINHPTNLVFLCPNHHWEFDRGRLPFNASWLQRIQGARLELHRMPPVHPWSAEFGGQPRS